MASRSSPLGYDMHVRVDMDRNGRSSSGPELVGNAILHRVTTGNIPLIESDSDYIEYGEDVRLWVGEALTQERLNARAAGLGPIIERDPRVVEVEAIGILTTSPGSIWDFELTVAAKLRTGETISQVIGISSVTVDILAQGT